MEDVDEHVGSDDSLDLVVSVAADERHATNWQESVIYVNERCDSLLMLLQIIINAA